MKKETLAQLLHRYYPEWNQSILETRENLGFSFNFTGQERWNWFSNGKHREVCQQADRQMLQFKLPSELARYWVCCFYADYLSANNIQDLSRILGPPYLTIPCPSSTVGEDWRQSVNTCKSLIMAQYNLGNETDLFIWASNPESINEVGEIALEQVKQLGLSKSFAIAWACCFLPTGSKYLVHRSWPLLKSLTQLPDWHQFMCSAESPRKRVRAYPFGIDWNEGVEENIRRKLTVEYLQERGMNLIIDTDSVGNPTYSLTWRPEMVRVNELRRAVERAQRYYQERYRNTVHSPLQILTQNFIHRAKANLANQKGESARARFKSKEATFEQLLCEEALNPEIQSKYHQLVRLYQKSPAQRQTILQEYRLLRKQVYDRVRTCLKTTGLKPNVAKQPLWWAEVLPPLKR